VAANGRDGFCHTRLATPIDDDPSAFGGEGFGNGETDTGGGAGDEGEFIFKLEVHAGNS